MTARAPKFRYTMSMVHPAGKHSVGHFGLIEAYQGKELVLHIGLAFGTGHQVICQVNICNNPEALKNVIACLHGLEDHKAKVLEQFSTTVPWSCTESEKDIKVALNWFLSRPLDGIPDVIFTDEKGIQTLPPPKPPRKTPPKSTGKRGANGRTLPRPELKESERVNRLTLFRPRVPSGLVAIVEVFQGPRTLLTETIYSPGPAGTGGITFEPDVEVEPDPNILTDPVVQAEVEAALRGEKELQVLVQEPRGKKQYEADLSDALDGWLNELFR